MISILIVGLGLIGGSYALALDGLDDCKIIGADRSPDTLDFARQHGFCHHLTEDATTCLSDADVVVLCLHPQGILDFLTANASRFKRGALVTDVCGVKTAVMRAAQALPDGVDFIGCHPMAGKESSGIRNAAKNLFFNAHFIITPRQNSTPEHIKFLEKMALHMGFRDIVNTSAEHHDAIIAYTSQIMHIMAAAVCDDPDLFDCKGFEGGSFRDCTRVAALDVGLWTQLFSLNSSALCTVIERLENNLRSYRETIMSGDTHALAEKLTFSSDRKRHMNVE